MEQTSVASPTTTQATTTIGDASAALALADSSLAEPAQTSPTASDAPAATQQAQTEPAAQEPVSTDPPKGEPPKWRWQDILANARETSAKEAEARVRQEIESRYQWTQGIQEQERNDLLALHRALNGDANARQYVARVNPTFAEAAGWTNRPAQPAADPEPQPDFMLPVRDAQGNVVGERPIYSAERQAEREAWLERQWMAKIDKKIAPLQQTAETLQAREATASYGATTQQTIAALEQAIPEFKDAGMKREIWNVISSDPQLQELALAEKTAGIAIRYAANEVYRTKVLPGKQSQTEAQVLAKLQQQAVAGTTNPATASPAAPKQTLGDARAALAHATSVLGG